MKFVCGAGALAEGLKRVSGALPARSASPILEGVKIECGEGRVNLTCSDERVTIVTAVPAEVSEPGRGVAPGRLFNEVVRGFSGSDVTVQMNERHAFSLRGGGSRTNLSGQDADLYPSLPEVVDEHVISMPQGVLKRMIEKTAFAIAVEDTREALTGALLEFAGGEATMVGLDGFRMAVCRARLANAPEGVSAIVPGKALTDLGKLLTYETGATVDVAIGGGKLRAAVDGTEFYASLIRGNYIDFRSILPKNSGTIATVGVAALRQAVDRAALIARQGNNNLLVLRMLGGEMAVESKSEIGDVHEAVDALLEGDDLSIAFNAKYLIDMLRNADFEDISLGMNGAIAPCVAGEAGGGGDVTYLVLPVRTTAV